MKANLIAAITLVTAAIGLSAFAETATPSPSPASTPAPVEKPQSAPLLPERPMPKPEAAPVAVAPEPKAEPSDAPAAPSTQPTLDITPAETEIGARTEPAGPPLPESLRESDFDYTACLLTLVTLGTGYEELAPITEADSPDCGIARPVRITEILPGITLDEAPVMRCDTARHLAFWLRDYVRPASAMLEGAPRLVGIAPGSTYQCRGVVGGTSSAKVSEHALGNAFDIAAFRFDDGRRIEVQPRKDEGSLLEAFQTAIRGSACLHFTTVLGPGANAAHDDHLHLDIKARKGGYRLCQ